MEDDPWMRTGEICRYLKLSHGAVVRALETEELAGRKTPGGHRQARRSAVLAYEQRMSDPSQWKAHPRKQKDDTP